MDQFDFGDPRLSQVVASDLPIQGEKFVKPRSFLSNYSNIMRANANKQVTANVQAQLKECKDARQADHESFDQMWKHVAFERRELEQERDKLLHELLLYNTKHVNYHELKKKISILEGEIAVLKTKLDVLNQLQPKLNLKTSIHSIFSNVHANTDNTKPKRNRGQQAIQRYYERLKVAARV